MIFLKHCSNEFEFNWLLSNQLVSDWSLQFRIYEHFGKQTCCKHFTPCFLDVGEAMFLSYLIKKCRHCPKKKHTCLGLEVSNHISSRKYYVMEKGNKR